MVNTTTKGTWRQEREREREDWAWEQRKRKRWVLKIDFFFKFLAANYSKLYSNKKKKKKIYSTIDIGFFYFLFDVLK